MQGLVFTGNRQVVLEEFPDPVPGPSDVVVAIRAFTLDQAAEAFRRFESRGMGKGYFFIRRLVLSFGSEPFD